MLKNERIKYKVSGKILNIELVLSYHVEVEALILWPPDEKS